MAHALPARTPAHLWIVGILSLLWNGFGCYNYFMTRTQGESWIRQMMHTDDGAAILAYLESFPIWASAGWAVGVWAGLLGSVLLLMRNWLAVPAFAVSLAGAVASNIYQLMYPADIAELTGGLNAVMPFVIMAIAVALLLYARAQRAKGVLS